MSLAIRCWFWLTLLLVVLPGPAWAATARVATVQDGPSPWGETLQERIREAMSELGGSSLTVEFPEELQTVAAWTPASVEAALAELAARRDVDLVLAIGPVAGHLAMSSGPPAHPTVVPFVVDREFQQAPSDGVGTGVPGLHYLAQPPTFQRDLRQFAELAGVEEVAFVVSEHMVAAVRGAGPPPEQPIEIEDPPIRLWVVPAGGNPAAIVDALPAETGGVYLGPLFHLGGDSLSELVERLNARSLPTFSMAGPSMVQRGALGSLGHEALADQLVRRTALDSIRILRGAAAESLPVMLQARAQLTINMATAARLGISPTFELLAEAEFVGEPEPARSLTLDQAIERALQVAPSLQAERVDPLLARQDLRSAQALWAPTLDVGIAGSLLDADRFVPSAGNAPAPLVVGNTSLSQLVFSEEALLAIAVQKRLISSAEAELRGAELDIVQATVGSYLDVLAARAAVAIYRNNLRLVRRNFELSEDRVRLGQASPAELFRWRSEVANARTNLVQARALEQATRTILNQLLQLPPTELIGVDSEALLAAGLPDSSVRLRTPADVDRLAASLVEIALAENPELELIDQSLAVLQRQLLSKKLKFALPTAGFGASIDHTLVPSIDVPDVADGFQWSLGLSLTLPLFDAKRYPELDAARLQVERLEATRRDARTLLESGIHAQARAVGASYATIGLARESADAAQAALEATAEAYAVGAESVVSLLEAQTNALNAELSAATAELTFVRDLVSLERSVGSYSLLRGEPGQLGQLRQVGDEPPDGESP